MKKMLIFYLFLMSSLFLFSDQQISHTEIENSTSKNDTINFHEEFIEAFEDVIEAATHDFEDVLSDSETVKIDSLTYKKVLLNFPDSEFAFYQKLKESEKNKTAHSIKIVYEAKKKKLHPFLEDNEYYETYEQLIQEFENIQKFRVGGNWQMQVNQKGVKMNMVNYPFLKVYMKPSGKTGFELEFNLPKEDNE